MQHFVSACQSVFRRKITMVVVVLIIPALLGLGNLVKQMPQFAGIAHCSPHTIGHRSAQSCQRDAALSSSQAIGQTDHSLNSDLPGLDPAKISKLKQWFASRQARMNEKKATPPPARMGLSPVKTIPTPVPTTPNPAPTSPTPPPVPSGQGSVAAMIYQIFGSYAAGALQVAKCESGLNPSSYNPASNGGSHASGVFQILYPSTWMNTSEASSSPFNAQANILAAHEIFVRDGYSWREWSCAA
jgi:hypothetical protein